MDAVETVIAALVASTLASILPVAASETAPTLCRSEDVVSIPSEAKDVKAYAASTVTPTARKIRVVFSWPFLPQISGVSLTSWMRQAPALDQLHFISAVWAAADLLGMSVQPAVWIYKQWTPEGRDEAADLLAWAGGVKAATFVEEAIPTRGPRVNPARGRCERIA